MLPYLNFDKIFEDSKFPLEGGGGKLGPRIKIIQVPCTY